MVKRLTMISILLAVCLVLAFPTSAAQMGSVSIRKVTLPVEIYRVAEKSGEATSVFAKALSEPLTQEILTPETARKLKTYAETNKLKGQTATPDGNKEISFAALEEGYYLICSRAEKGEFAPFLVRIPMTIGQKLVYDIEATPKVQTPNTPNTPATPVKPKPNIPQTGNVQWPKYLMLVLGGAAIVAGFVEVLRGREKTYE